MTIKIKRLRADESFIPPSYAHPTDTGLDLACSSRIVVRPHSFAQIHTNLAVALPDGLWGLLLPRSSTFLKRGLLTHSGVIDNAYRGEIVGLVYNPNGKSVLIKPGDRVLQLVLIPMSQAKPIPVIELPPSTRGESGFGSTGQ